MLRGRDAWIIVALVFILGILIVVFMTTKKESDNLFNNLLDKKDSSQNEGNSQDNRGDNQSQGGAGTVGEGGGNGGGNSGGASGSSQNCISEQITYSMLELNKTEVCNSYQGDICIDKTVSCSVDIENRDNSKGSFEVGLYFVERGKEITESFDSKIRNFNLEAGEIYLFDDFTRIQSAGEDGLANKGINCYYINLIIPVKEVCE